MGIFGWKFVQEDLRVWASVQNGNGNRDRLCNGIAAEAFIAIAMLTPTPYFMVLNSVDNISVFPCSCGKRTWLLVRFHKRARLPAKGATQYQTNTCANCSFLI